MSGREAALRTKRFEADESAKKIDHLDVMIRDFEALATDLDRQVQAEEERTGIRDTLHFGYSTFAKSAAQRRDNLRASASELRTKLEALIRDRGDAELELAQAVSIRDTTVGRPTNGRVHNRPISRRRPQRSTAVAALAR